MGDGTAGSDASQDSESAGATRNPLWVISLFLGLCQFVAGTVTALTAGAVQLIFSVFVVAYPVLVASAFFVILWKKPGVFYAPRDYSTGVSPADLAEAFSADRRTEEVVRNVAGRSVAEIADSLLERRLISEKVHKEITRDGQRRVDRAIAENAVHLDLADFDAGTADILISNDSTVNDLLNSIWFKFRDLGIKMPPRTYGTSWLLQDPDTGRLFRDIGGDWAKKTTGSRNDRRGLAKVGIGPGVATRAIDLRSFDGGG